jgi:hypothetical protein
VSGRIVLPEMLRRDRERLGLTIGQAAFRCRMSRDCSAVEAREANITSYEAWAALRATCTGGRLDGLPQKMRS